MAFTVTARQSGNSAETAAETLTTSSATPTADSLLLVCSAAQNDNHQIAPTYEDPSGGGLSYTQVDTIGEVPWDGSASFALSAAVERAAVGGSPSGFTVTVDHWSNSQTAYYGAVCLDITGHDDTAPIVQSKTAGASKGGGSAESGSVTLDSAPSSGNLVVVAFGAGADNGGGFATPTLGGQAMTAVTNQDASFTQVGVFSRVVDGTESDDTITCTDLGDVVGNFTAIAIEIAAEAGATDVTANDSVHAHAADQPSLTQTHVLTSVDATHAHTADQPSLTQVHAISVDSASHAHTADAAGLTQTHSLTPDAASHAHSAAQPTLGQVHALATDNASHGHTADQPTITSAGDLAVNSALHSHTADQPALTGVHVLSPADALHGHTADQPVLTSGVVITPDDALHAHAADQPSLTQVHVLAPADAAHGHTADQVALTQLHVLAVADALHAHAADAATITVGALPESIVTAQGTHSLIATAAGTYAPTATANGTHDLIVEAEGAL